MYRALAGFKSASASGDNSALKIFVSSDLLRCPPLMDRLGLLYRMPVVRLIIGYDLRKCQSVLLSFVLKFIQILLRFLHLPFW